jgi:hypothetical protein
MHELRIAGHGATVIVGIRGYEKAKSELTDVPEWLEAELRIETPAIRWESALAVSTKDLARFLKTLQAAHQGNAAAAKFDPLEGDLTLDLDFGKRGDVVVRVAAKSGDARLELAFPSDRTYLEPSVQQLRDLVRRFPVRGF